MKKWTGAAVMLSIVVGFGVFVFEETRPAAPQPHGLSKPELAWAVGYDGWRTRTRPEMTRAFFANRDATTAAQVDRPLRPLAGCAASFRQQVGPAPKGFAAVASSAFSACGHAALALARWRSRRYVADPPRGYQLLAAVRALDDADAALLDRLLISRPLPSISEASDQSRIQPRFGEAATAVTSYDNHVRCWSKHDWPAVQHELAAIGRSIWPRLLGAAQSAGLGVDEQLGPETCGPLDALVYQHEAPTSGSAGAGLVDALFALGREAERQAGAFDAPDAGCYALQDVRPLAIEFGLGAATAGKLAALALSRYHAKQLPNTLFSARCVNGGPLDKYGDQPWP